MRFFSLLLAACLAPVAMAQTSSPTGTIQGVVVDSTGALVAGAKVIARHDARGQARETSSDEQGRFFLQSLQIGEYSLRATKEGFTSAQTAAFQVSLGQVVVQKLMLTVAGVTGSIEVSEAADAIDSTATTSSAALGGERIEEAPARGRNYLNFVTQAPGLAQSNSGAVQKAMTAVRNPAADSGFSFAGMRGRNNSIDIDGVDNRDETTGASRVGIGLEMVQEFRVAGSVTGAELGGAAGGLINVVTRTGVNLMHGDFTYFTQNTDFNARKPEVESPGRPRFVRIQPGASWYGPVKHDKTFIAVALEAERESAEEWSETPDYAARRINAVLGGRNMAGIPTKQVLNGLFDTLVRGTEGFAKLNHQFDAKDSIAVRYAVSRGRSRYDVQGPMNFQDRSAGGSSLTTDHSLVGNWFRVASPKIVLETRFQYGRREQEITPNGSGPMLEIPGVVSFGQGYRVNSSRAEDHLQAVENVTWIHGRHRLSAGASIHSVSLDSRIANRFGGIFVFPTLEAFEQNRPDMFLQAFGSPATKMRTLPVGAWLQDRVQLREGLTLEAGLRYDRQQLPAGIFQQPNQWSPRIGLAWQPWKRRALVTRIGYGLFHDRFPLAFLNEAVQKDGVNAFEQYATGDAAVAAYSAARMAPIVSPLAGLQPVVYRASSSFPVTYSRKLTAGLEYGLSKETTLSLEASDVRGLHLPRMRNIDALPPLFLLEQSASSAYQGVSVSMNRRMSKELALLVNYNIGRARDDASDFDEQPLDPRNTRLDWGRSRQYQKHRFSASGTYEIPTEDIGGPEWLKSAIDKWNLAPVFVAGSGRPLNTLLTTDVYRTGAYPISARPLGFARNSQLGPATYSIDVRLMKTIPFHENRARLQFGVESFNLANHSNPVMLSEFYSTPSNRLGSYKKMIESGTPRQIQFFMQFEY